MSSESDDEDFLSADEGDEQEPLSKTDKDVKVTKSLPSKVDRTEDKVKEAKKGDRTEDKIKDDKADDEVKDTKKDERAEDKKGKNEKNKSNSKIKKMETKYSDKDICDINEGISKCKISENLEKSSLSTNTPSKEFESEQNVPSLPLETANEAHLKSSCSDADIVSPLDTNVEADSLLQKIEVQDVESDKVAVSEIETQMQDVSDKVITPEPIESESQACSTATKSHTIKESKIGLKKPREKLGERLGNKKLGSRVTKPLVGISSDSLCSQNVTEVTTLPGKMDKSNTENETDAKEQNKDKETNESPVDWGSWGSWGSSLATAATTITRGVGSVLETVESSIGAPDPEELAKEMVEKEKELEELKKEHKLIESKIEQEESGDTPSFGFGFGSLGTLVYGVSGALGNASNKVLLGGLSTLETIGRKTMDIIQDGDPGLRRKRAFLTSKKENLSLVLLEARERAIAEEELRAREASSEMSDRRKQQVSMALLWDNTEGPAHGEALSLVAKQCQSKTNLVFNDIAPAYHSKIMEKIEAIKNCSCLNEKDKTENIPRKLMEITRDVQLPLQFANILNGWPAFEKSLKGLSIEICGLGGDFSDIQKDLYKLVSKYVAVVIGIFHKAAEVSLITSKLDCLKIAQQFQSLYSCISGGLEKYADDVCESISKVFPSSDPEFNGTITNIYVQMAEANSYLENALLDLIIILTYAEAKSAYVELL